MFPFSFGFKLAVFLLWSLGCAGGGFYFEMLRWDNAEAGRPLAVAKIVKVIDRGNQKALVHYRAKAAELDKLNINLEKELEYAKTQVRGSCTFGPGFVSVWDAKLEGRPVGVPSAPGGVPDGASEAGDATVDDLLKNEARNAASCAADRQKLEGLREWACRVHKLGCPEK